MAMETGEARIPQGIPKGIKELIGKIRKAEEVDEKDLTTTYVAMRKLYSKEKIEGTQTQIKLSG